MSTVVAKGPAITRDEKLEVLVDKYQVSSPLSGIPKFVCFPLFPHGLFTSLYQIPQREADARNRIPGIDGSPYLREPSTAPPFLRPP